MQTLPGRVVHGLLFLFFLGVAPAGRSAAEEPGRASPGAERAPEAAAQLAEQATAGQLAILNGPADEPRRRVSRHYLWSNERRHDIFFGELQGLGRGYVGVGADQNYTLAAAARADVAWLVDLDAAVVSLHHLYGAAIAAAPTAEELLLLLSGRRDEALRAAAAARLLDARTRAAALQVYEEYGPLLYERLRRQYGVGHSRPGGAAANWLNDPLLYAHVRKLALAGRIVPRLGDLNGPTMMVQIGEAARAAGVPVRVLYLSNAESWFGYGARLLRNLRALPFDDRSVVLRTVKSEVLRYPAGDVWHFSVQGAQDFVEKLALRRYRSVDVIMADVQGGQAEQGGRPRGLSRIAAGVPTQPAPVVEGLITRPSASPSTPLGDNKPDV